MYSTNGYIPFLSTSPFFTKGTNVVLMNSLFNVGINPPILLQRTASKWLDSHLFLVCVPLQTVSHRQRVLLDLYILNSTFLSVFPSLYLSFHSQMHVGAFCSGRPWCFWLSAAFSGPVSGPVKGKLILKYIHFYLYSWFTFSPLWDSIHSLLFES